MKLVETGSIPISEIEFGKRLRAVDEAWATGLAELIGQSHLQNPIQLLKVGNELRLVAGAHRLRAFQILNRHDIPAAIYEPESDKPDLELRLAEIDENLGRNELNVLDRAASIAERQRVYRELYGDPRGGDRKTEKSKRQTLPLWSIKDDIAAKMGLSERTIRAAAEMFHGLSAASRKRAAGTWLADNHVQLRQLSQLDAEHQHKALDLILAEEPKARNVNEAVCIIERRPKAKTDNAKLLARLQKQYLSAPKPVQREFQQWLDTLDNSNPRG